MFAYNKPDTTKKVFNQIAKVKPKQMYLIVDGPKNKIEKELCDKTKKVLQDIKWDCNIERIYHKENQGLKKIFNSGLEFVFSNEERAIILEDDTLPSISFFRYCDLLLEKYVDNTQIAQINGYNYLSKVNLDTSYYFSVYSELWGWATWSDRWKKYNNRDFDNWDIYKKTDEFKNIFSSEEEFKYFYNIYDNAHKNKINSWEFPWTYSTRINKLITISPKVNLVKNLGFGHSGATHTHQRHKYLSVTRNKKFEIDFPLKHPEEIIQDNYLIEREFNKRLLKNSKLSKFIYRVNKLKNYIN